MQGRIRRLWQGWAGTRGAVGAPRSPRRNSASTIDGDSTTSDERALPDPERPATHLPEQPVLLMPSGDTRPVHVGELLPARRRPWPLAIIRLPAIPKRAILAAGVCAGLAAPTLARHLATRILLGNPAARADGVLEITRIVYTGPLTPRSAAAIGKVLTAGRR